MSKLTPHTGGFSMGAAKAPSAVTAVAKGKAKTAKAAAKEKNRISDGVVEVVEVVDGVESDGGFECSQGGGPGRQERSILLIPAHERVHGDERVPSLKERRRRAGEPWFEQPRRTDSHMYPSSLRTGIYGTNKDPSRGLGLFVVEWPWLLCAG